MDSNLNLPALNSKQLGSTRDYLQDISKIMGKFQQLFLNEEPHESQRGLLVTRFGLSTQLLQIGSQELRAEMNLLADVVGIGDEHWQLGKVSPQQLLKEWQQWLDQKGLSKKVNQPQFSSIKPEYDQLQAHNIARIMSWIADCFDDIEPSLLKASHTRVLLFPHHFDLNKSWYWRTDNQISIGFSLGDENITEPYIYITAYPETAGLASVELPDKAYWQKDGFSGLVLDYNELSIQNNPDVALKKLLESVLSQISQKFAV